MIIKHRNKPFLLHYYHMSQVLEINHIFYSLSADFLFSRCRFHRKNPSCNTDQLLWDKQERLWKVVIFILFIERQLFDKRKFDYKRLIKDRRMCRNCNTEILSIFTDQWEHSGNIFYISQAFHPTSHGEIFLTCTDILFPGQSILTRALRT